MIAAVRSAAAYVAVSLYVAITAPIGMLLALVFRWKGLLYVFGHGGVRLGLMLSGITFHVAGRDNLPLGRAAVYCANHQSNVDPPVLFAALHPRMHILYKSELNALPLLPRALRMGGFIPIDRRDRDAAMRSIEAGARSIRAGNSFLIFPEGTRSRTETLLPFKKGGIVMAMKAGAPIVPIAIQGGRDAMRKGSWIIRPATIGIRVGPPIETKEYRADQREALITRLRGEIERLLQEGRSTQPAQHSSLSTPH